jgi:hypothetical protein
MWQRVWVTPAAVQLPPYLFDQQREACLTCSHCERDGDAMTCKVANSVGCSQARLPGEACGPDAALRNHDTASRPLPGSRQARLLKALKAGGGRMTVAQLAGVMGISPENVNTVARKALADKRVTRELGAQRGFIYALVETQ